MVMDSFTDTHCKFLEYLDYIHTDEQPYHKLKRRPQNGNRWTLIVIRAEKLLTWRTFEKQKQTHTHTHGPLSGTTFLPPNQQRQSTEGFTLEKQTKHNYKQVATVDLPHCSSPLLNNAEYTDREQVLVCPRTGITPNVLLPMGLIQEGPHT